LSGFWRRTHDFRGQKKEAVKALKFLPKANLRKFQELKDALRYEAVPRDRFDIVKLKGSEDLDIYRVRIGEYLVSYSVNWKARGILIHKVKKREDAYK
jgi:mRNA interferase RelE/StbE